MQGRHRKPVRARTQPSATSTWKQQAGLRTFGLAEDFRRLRHLPELAFSGTQTKRDPITVAGAVPEFHRLPV